MTDHLCGALPGGHQLGKTYRSGRLVLMLQVSWKIAEVWGNVYSFLWCATVCSVMDTGRT